VVAEQGKSINQKASGRGSGQQGVPDWGGCGSLAAGPRCLPNNDPSPATHPASEAQARLAAMVGGLRTLHFPQSSSREGEEGARSCQCPTSRINSSIC